MNAPDLHPEDLLDKEAHGALTDGERALLDGHVAKCAACRFERRARVDFRADLLPVATEADVDRLVREALGVARPPLPQVTARARSRRSRPIAASLLVAAVIATMGSVAFAARFTRVWPAILAATSPASAPPAAPPAARASSGRGRGRAAPAEPVPPPIVDVPVAEAPAPVAEIAAVLAPIAAAVAPPARRVVAGAATSEVPPAVAAAALFDRAGRARVHGEPGAAKSLYEELIRRYPRAAEASLAQVVLGRLLLDEGDAPGALARFEAYVGDGDPTLREEALAGRAVALGKLGGSRAADEVDAWGALLDAYPDSIHAARARARMRSLGGR